MCSVIGGEYIRPWVAAWGQNSKRFGRYPHFLISVCRFAPWLNLLFSIRHTYEYASNLPAWILPLSPLHPGGVPSQVTSGSFFVLTCA